MSAPFEQPADSPPPKPPAAGPMQRSHLIALAVGAALVLIAGVVAVARSGGDETASTATNPLPAPATTTIVATTTSTTTSTTSSTTSTTTSTSTTTTTTTTVPPAPAVANAGLDRAVDVATEVVLSATDLSESNQSVVWRQVDGPDVTDNGGRWRGNDPSFVAPDQPAALLFEVDVTGRGGDVDTDRVRIDVFEDADQVVFVDAVVGNDANPGSRSQPFRTLAHALQFTNGAPTDVYLRTVDVAYATGGESLDAGSSMYGGYDADWFRDLDRRTEVTVGPGGLTVVSSASSVVSGVDLVGADATTVDAVGLVVQNVEHFELVRATVRAGSSTSGASIGMRVASVGDLRLHDVAVRSGRGGDGRTGAGGSGSADRAAVGNDAPADPPQHGAGGGNGGDGGAGGLGLAPGASGGPGGEGGAGGEPGVDGVAGPGGGGGVGGAGGGGTGPAAGRDGDPTGVAGSDGERGGRGVGGRGGGGGGGLVVHDGGGGGGGGAGGSGGAPGRGGGGGRGSVGVWLLDVGEAFFERVSVQSGSGGRGGDGGDGTSGGAGGSAGDGAEGISTFLTTSGSGGGGGGGGSGGQAGMGGGGAGGRSIGLITARVGAIDVIGSVIRAGTGGEPGSGGVGGLRGVPGASGSNRSGGNGADGLDPNGRRAATGTAATGGDSIGWADDGATSRTITEIEVNAGTPGPGGVAIRTMF